MGATSRMSAAPILAALRSAMFASGGRERTFSLADIDARSTVMDAMEAIGWAVQVRRATSHAPARFALTTAGLRAAADDARAWINKERR